MRKVGYTINLAVALTLLVGIFRLSSGPGPWALDGEKAFIGGLHNSLYYLDQAKQLWAEEKNKSELDTPTLQVLMPYLGDWKDTIERFTALGINYRITSMAEHQSDVATLTRDLRFRRGYCLFYRAGTSYCIRTGWAYPPRSITSKSFRTLYFENNLDHLLEAAFLMLVAGNLFVLIAHFRHRHEKGTA